MWWWKNSDSSTILTWSSQWVEKNWLKNNDRRSLTTTCSWKKSNVGESRQEGAPMGESSNSTRASKELHSCSGRTSPSSWWRNWDSQWIHMTNAW
jgi:hypothetical protein